MNKQRPDGGHSKEEAYDMLVDEILTGELSPGTALTERALVARFGISRTPIRQVLWQLEHDDLVTLHPNRGAFVKKMGVEEVSDLFQVRVALEPLACALAATRRPEGELLELQHLLMDEALTKGSTTEEMIRRGEAMHDAIVEWSRSHLITKIYASLSLQARLMRNLLRNAISSESTSLLEHRLILAAVAERNPDLARQRMTEHLVRARDAVLNELFVSTLAFEPANRPR